MFLYCHLSSSTFTYNGHHHHHHHQLDLGNKKQLRVRVVREAALFLVVGGAKKLKIKRSEGNL